MGKALEPASTVLPAALEADAQAARDFARESLSPATRRAYRGDIRAFEAWCRERGLGAVPAAPEAVASFLAHEARRGLAVSSISHWAAAIRLFHRAAGHATPTESGTRSKHPARNPSNARRCPIANRERAPAMR